MQHWNPNQRNGLARKASTGQAARTRPCLAPGKAVLDLSIKSRANSGQGGWTPSLIMTSFSALIFFLPASFSAPSRLALRSHLRRQPDFDILGNNRFDHSGGSATSVDFVQIGNRRFAVPNNFNSFLASPTAPAVMPPTWAYEIQSPQGLPSSRPHSTTPTVNTNSTGHAAPSV